ncbi:hypothetical protein C5614_30030, partial [Massilia phosphatilytica]
GIAQGDLAFSRSGYDLVVKIADPQNPATADQVTLQSWYSSSYYQIEQLVFADGSTLSAAQIVGVPNINN